MMQLPLQKTSERGFTLVETLVAIAILMIAIVGPYYSIQQAIMTSYVARDQLIASSLAQEGAEYMYLIRDTNYLNSRGWMDTIPAICFSTDGCGVDPSANLFADCSNNQSCVLNLQSNGYYGYGSGTVTRFSRAVKIRNINANQVQVTVSVTWVTGQHGYSVNTVENLYNWL